MLAQAPWRWKEATSGAELSATNALSGAGGALLATRVKGASLTVMSARASGAALAVVAYLARWQRLWVSSRGFRSSRWGPGSCGIWRGGGRALRAIGSEA